MPQHIIACRLSSYGHFMDEAWTHLPSIGVQHIEVYMPPADELPELRKKTADHGLQVSSFHCPCDIKQDGVVEDMGRQFDCFPEFDTRICFTSVHTGDTAREVVWERLRRIGDAAAARDVVVAMETHPDLVENARNARATMEAVNHPHIRVNFDTANVYYYNHNVTTVGELESTADFVASIHLKDTMGGYHSDDFPKLGDGVVDFPGVFALMDERGFAGPYTMELEGVTGAADLRQAQLQNVADSVAYLRSIGV